MKKIALLLLLVAFPVLGQENISAVETGRFFTVADQYVGFDGFGFQYLIKDNALIKTNGKDRWEYKKVALGKITRVDITNPLMIVLFYEAFNTVVMVDNQLNEVKTVDFNNLHASIADAVIVRGVGLASQNRLWVYDGLTRQLGLYDYSAATFKTISTPLKDEIKYYQTDYNYFQWIDTKGDWYACDVFGKVTTLGNVPAYASIRLVSGQSFLYETGGKVLFRDLKNNTTQTVSGIDNSLKNFYYQAQILAIFTSSVITNYKINLP